MMSCFKHLTLCILAAFMSHAGMSAAAPYNQEACVMASGGGFSSTVGQPSVIGISSGGGYTNCAGFWCVNRGVADTNAWVQLSPGLNLFGMPVGVPAAAPYYYAQDLLGDVLLVGESGNVHRYNSAGHAYEAAASDGGGVNFNLANGEGYLLYVDQGKTVRFTGPRNCPTLTVRQGLNVITRPCATTDDTSYDLLSDLGGPAAVASIQRYDSQTGLFETTGTDGSTVVGPDFPIRRGEAYLVNMR